MKSSFTVQTESRYHSSLLLDFMERQTGESFVHVYDTWIVRKKSLVDLVEGIAGFLKTAHPEVFYRGIQNDCYYVEWETGALVLDPSISGRSVETPNGGLTIPLSIIGPRAEVERVLAYMDEQYPRTDRVEYQTAKWWFLKSTGEVAHTNILVGEPPSARQEYYPWLPDFDKFFQGYIADDSQILFLMGPPGTGKTTLLRSIIYDKKLSVAVAYDEQLFKNDAMFIDFMTSSHQDVLIIEDADLLLTSREHSGNKLISRFLNVSDGIIRFPKKKIIFTSNLSDFSDVDVALTRAGRCYGVVRARELTFEEAKVAATAGGLIAPTEDREYSLAELFKKPVADAYVHKQRRVGFRAA